ncbi:TlpA family protein disulfide reductase [Chitinophaga lutea]|uniref:TlpA family protein disulfide reductase n=1 Tax=Chitinophaga lutea TaxID=2488634 RepID=A0A3N4QKH7_9BACT|nr:TlpA family protein disulfide reductase [Chitinophaga lutea]
MFMSRLFFVMVAGGSFFCCAENNIGKAAPITADSVITLVSKLDAAFGFYYKDGISSHPSFLAKDVPFRIKSRIPVYIMQPDENQTGYYLRPGDSIVVAKDRTGTIEMKTADPVRNNELAFFSRLSRDIGAVRHLGNKTYIRNEKVDLKERDSLINKKHQERLGYLHAYQAKHKVSAGFVDYAGKAFYYAGIYEKLYLFYPGYDRNKIRSFYRDSLSGYRKTFNCDTCLDHAFFTDALVQVARTSAEKEINATRPFLFYSGLNAGQLRQIYDSAKLHFTGKVRSYMQSDILELLIANRQVSQTEAENLRREIDDEDFREQIGRQIKMRFKRELAGNLSGQKLFSPDSSFRSWNDFLKQHRNRVLYIDFWASWCVPCLAAMPASLKLKRKYAGKPVDFIYISLDEDFDKWKSAAENQQIRTFSYWGEGDFVSLLAKKFKIASIPRYMIVDKAGNVFSDDAMGPGDSNLTPVLDDLIKR